MHFEPARKERSGLISPYASRYKRKRSDVEVLYVECVFFDELAARFDVFAHERCEDGLGFGDVFELDLEEGTALRVHGGFPELGGGHLAQTLVTLDLVLAAALLDEVFEEVVGGLLFDGLDGGLAGALGGGLAGFGFARGLAFGLFGIGRGWGLAGVLDEEGWL